MIIRIEIKETIGQAIKDLQVIATKDPGSYLSASNGVGDYYYITGTKFIDDIFALEIGYDEDEAITIEELLETLETVDDDTKIVLASEDFIMPLDPDDDGSLFQYSEYDADEGEKKFNNYYYKNQDVRLLTVKHIGDDIQRFKDYPDRKIIYRDDHGKAIYINYAECLRRIENKPMVLRRIKDNDYQDLAVSNFIGWNNSSKSVLGFFYVRREDMVYLRNIEVGDDGHIFFEDKVGDEDVIAFRMGETIYEY